MNKTKNQLLEEYKFRNERLVEFDKLVNDGIIDPQPPVIRHILNRMLHNPPKSAIYGLTTEEDAIKIAQERKTYLNNIKLVETAIRKREDADKYEKLLEQLNRHEEKLERLFEQRMQEFTEQFERKKAKKPKQEPQRLKPGCLPGELCNETAKKLLKKAIDLGVIDVCYQPVPGTTNAQLFVLSYGIAIELGVKQYHKLFGQIWGNKDLNHVNWHIGQASMTKMTELAEIFSEATKERLLNEYMYGR